MFENFYTTKMDSGKKRLKQRFLAMRQKPKKSAKALSVFAAGAVLLSAICGGGAVFAASNRPKSDMITVMFEGEEKNLKTAPFVSNGEVYLPLREILNICGINNIFFENGKTTVVFYPQELNGEPLKAFITAGENGIVFDLDQNKRIMGINDAGKNQNGKATRSTTHPAVILNDTTFVPCGMIIRLKNYYTAKDYDDRIYLDLLAGLEIRFFDSEGKFDAIICEPKPKEGGDKFSPESYYDKDEKVFVGTAEEFQKFDFKHTEINGYYFPQSAEKRILVDENNKVIAVFPYENFRHESVNPSCGGTSLWQTVSEYFPVASVAQTDAPSFKLSLKNKNEFGFEKRGGFNVFLNILQTDKNQNRCLDYCFVDFRYLVK